MLNFKIILYYVIISPPPLRNGYADDRPGIVPCIFATSAALPLAAPVPATIESMSATALMTSMPSVCSVAAAPPCIRSLATESR